ncbi:MAG: hypothetical protein JSV76_05375 [Candidatus Bathyarchaeota archaeon]|nr:MAG: hypothetical protein JSV76_05375 [Candidatus Bathyarchaeota archaeon]
MLELTFANRMRIILDPQERVNFSEKAIRYYARYALGVLATLRDPFFRRFIYRLLNRENIAINRIHDIRIKTFPKRNEQNGKKLIGKCSTNGTISIYPKDLKFMQQLRKTREPDNVTFYVTSRARATLMHELLHLKYFDRERKVRALTERYFTAFLRHRKLDGEKRNLLKQLFRKKTNPPKLS